MSSEVTVPPEPRHPPKVSVNKAWLRALEMTSKIERTPLRLLASVVEERAEAAGAAPALVSDGESLSYAALAARTRRYARWGLAQGLAKGEVVALMMGNCPEYLAIWLGLTRIGVVVALINTSLRGQALTHCLAVAAPRRIIAAAELAGAARAAADRLEEPPALWVHGEASGARIDLAILAVSDDPLAPNDHDSVSVRDPALLIYTSGTTGLPKAARVSHHRVMSWSSWFSGLLDAQADDRLYDCLPMHHSVGGVAAAGAMLIAGAAVVIAPKFSVTRFWDDIVGFECTIFQYIGELCRYLVQAPSNPNETSHHLRIACGNGLGREVWTAFQSRFAIPRILEFYASTEGNFSLYNVEGHPGAIGRVPGFMAHRFPAALVRFDPAAGAPVRGADGLCQRCAPDEAGEAIGRISDAAGDPAHRFEGYTSAADSERKLLRDVFEPGDAWLRTGDLMRLDARGFYYFVDRIGDTFRWKGENVATLEVAEAIMACPGVSAAAVYGVTVPGAEGRAGMAAISVSEGFAPSILRAHLAQALPSYARPLFLRLTPGLAMTETFKRKTADLAAEGYDPRRISDPMLFDDPRRAAYAPLDAALFDAIAAGDLRL